MKILITGTAGFIGYNLALRMLEQGYEIVGLDIINDYYDVNLKYKRLEKLGIDNNNLIINHINKSNKYSNFKFIKADLANKDIINSVIKDEKITRICNLAAQAGVRYSLTNPDVYIQSNISGFINLLEAARYNDVEHLVYASSSSVYGLNKKMPFSVRDNVDHPISLYAASKKSNELMAHTYSHLFNIPTTGLRFFTVYGPWGRPDMALFLFTKAILENKPIDIFNKGNMKRDFTYIDDIVEGIIRVINNVPKGNPNWNPECPDPSSAVAPYRLYNIGNNQPVELLHFIEAIEKKLGIEAKKNFLPMQPGDVAATWADVNELIEDVDFKPNTTIEDGISRFVDWYKDYYSYN